MKLPAQFENSKSSADKALYNFLKKDLVPSVLKDLNTAQMVREGKIERMKAEEEAETARLAAEEEAKKLQEESERLARELEDQQEMVLQLQMRSTRNSRRESGTSSIMKNVSEVMLIEFLMSRVAKKDWSQEPRGTSVDFMSRFQMIS